MDEAQKEPDLPFVPSDAAEKSCVAASRSESWVEHVNDRDSNEEL